MDITVLAAKVLAVYMIVGGLFLLLKGKSVPNMLKDFFGHPALVYLSGIILIFLSTMFLLWNNVWDYSWRTVITVLAWLILIKGLAYIFAPRTLSELSIKRFRAWFGLYGLIAIFAGVYIFYFLV